MDAWRSLATVGSVSFMVGSLTVDCGKGTSITFAYGDQTRTAFLLGNNEKLSSRGRPVMPSGVPDTQGLWLLWGRL